MRPGAALVFVIAVLAGGCGGDDRPDLAAAPSTTDASGLEPGTTSSAEESMPASGSGSTMPTPLPQRQADDVAQRADDMEAAIGRWDEELATCAGVSGNADDADATCTHAAWGRLVFQADTAVYYLLGHLRGMSRGACHDALSPELYALRGFWQGGAPLDQIWLDEQQRPPALYDLEAVVDLIRPVPDRIRDALATVCAP